MEEILAITLPSWSEGTWLGIIGGAFVFLGTFMTGFWGFLGSYQTAKKEKKAADVTKEFNIQELLSQNKTAIAIAEIDEDRVIRQELREDLKTLKTDFRDLSMRYNELLVLSSEQSGQQKYMKLQLEGFEKSMTKLKELLDINTRTLEITRQELNETRIKLEQTAAERDQIRANLTKRVAELEGEVAGYLQEIDKLKTQIDNLEKQRGDSL